MDTPINVFSGWALNGKDEGMEKHHYQNILLLMLDAEMAGL